MFKHQFFIALLLATTLALAYAESPRSRGNAARRVNVRFLARQEVEATTVAAPDAALPPAAEPAPYPPAGVTPEIPFDLPTETDAPAPDQTYGPPDNTYGPPTGDQDIPAKPTPASDLVAQNLIQPRRNIARQQRGFVRSQPLLLQAVPIAGRAPRPGLVELVRVEPEF